MIAAAVVCAACGSDSGQSTASIEVSVQMRSNDLDGDGTAVDQVSIADEWRAFVADARDSLGGDPVDIQLTSAALRLEPSSTNVSTLGEVFNGPVVFRIEMSGSNGEYNLAEGLVQTGDSATSTELSLRFDYSRVDDADVAALLDGAFGVEFVGQASDEFRGANAIADLGVTFRFVAE